MTEEEEEEEQEILVSNIGLVKFLDSLYKQSPKVTIFKVLQLLRRPETQNRTFRDEGQDHKLLLRSESESIRHLNIGHVS